MKAQRSRRLSFISTWIFAFFLPPVCIGTDKPTLNLESRVFVALSGEDLEIGAELKKPANQTRDNLVCFSPSNQQIYHKNIQATFLTLVIEQLQLKLKNLTRSGEYYCQYKTAKVYWFLLVRETGYRSLDKVDGELIPVGIFTGMLLIFSVAGSVYVFRGHWKEKITKRGDTGRKQQKSREKKKDTEAEEDKMDMSAAQSTSFYASLEPRPRSIYDVLDTSAATTESDQKKDHSKTKKSQKPVPQTAEQQDEGIFESVYENF